ncbi:MAG: 1-phosphofructokinase family hexose kinase [Microbacteriaceae bacterium]
MRGIVTVTPAAAVDHTYLLPQLRLGQLNRVAGVHSELSGKGVNVGHAIALAGHPVTAVLTLATADLGLAERAGSGLRLRVLEVPGRTRINTTILEEGGRTTKVNQAPIPLTDEQWRGLQLAALEEVERIDAAWLVLCGSIPTRVGSDQMVPFTQLLRDAAARGVRVALDTSGAALHRAEPEFGSISLIKPNTHELADLVQRDLRTIAEVASAAAELRRLGVELVFVSMGEDGALLVAENALWWARARADAPINSAGAGDASLAGFLVGLGAQSSESALPRALATAASWGALAVTQSTTLLTSLDGATPATVLRDPDPSTLLRDPALLRH